MDKQPYQDFSQFFLFQIAGSGEMQINRFNFHDQLSSLMTLQIPVHNAPLGNSPGASRPEVYPAQFIIVASDTSMIKAGERIIWANGIPVFQVLTSITY